MIEIQRLTKRFGDLVALRELTLSVARGRVTGVVGPNAAGKTTLIKAILGLTHPDSGSVTVDGTVVNGDECYREKIGYMPQIARFPENMTVFELFAIVRDLRRHAQQPCAVDDDLVSRFGLGAMMHSPLRVLSGGSKQKVNAALAFLFSPSLLIMDEPTAGLDPVASSVLKDKILQVRSEQRTVLITSHVMRELQELADDVAVLVDGVVHFAGPVDDLLFRTRQPTLERAVAEVLSRPAAA